MLNKGLVAEIISIGTEITNGSTLNTNSSYISQKLMEMGIETNYHTSVDDDKNRLSEVLDVALKRSDLIITTGGLGPTEDDLTKEVLAKVLGQDLILDMAMKEHIESYFRKSHSVMTNNNIKQAYKLKDSLFLNNSIGTAPGIFIDINGKKIALLPGPPQEMSLMLHKELLPLIKSDEVILSKSINTVNIGESSLETELLKLNLNSNRCSIATFAKYGTVEIKIIIKSDSMEDAEYNMEKTIKKIKSRLKDYIYGYDNISLEETVINLLKEKNKSIGVSESCTGGLLSSRLTSVAGASEVFKCGMVTYSNESKHIELNVSLDTLEKEGAVSEATAYEMTKGLMEKYDLDIAISTTGIAGPGGASLEKPVGLVYMCIMTKEDHKIIKSNFSGQRHMIQNRTTIKALNEIRKVLLD